MNHFKAATATQKLFENMMTTKDCWRISSTQKKMWWWRRRRKEAEKHWLFLFACNISIWSQCDLREWIQCLLLSSFLVHYNNNYACFNFFFVHFFFAVRFNLTRQHTIVLGSIFIPFHHSVLFLLLCNIRFFFSKSSFSHNILFFFSSRKLYAKFDIHAIVWKKNKMFAFCSTRSSV